MQLSNVFAFAITLGPANTAAVSIAPRDGARVAQFRVYGADGCYEDNQGFWTVDTSDADACKPLGSNPPIASVRLEILSTTATGSCTVSLFTDTECTPAAHMTDMTVGACNNAPAPDVWQAWKLTCSV
ncbi:hypothetical protein F5Y17DRAFT_430722 [Xylariaceae sp. FL0594]|nr:hypothetical protein F5Y17DRAFT_430722 [Xylariaceae sp. FL0594]